MHVAVAAERRGSESAATELARRLGTELVGTGPQPAGSLVLAYTDAGLVLREGGASTAGPLLVEFRPGRGSGLLKRATMAGRQGVRRVIDATAGLGQDAFAIAEAGAEVDLIERSPVLAALLADGLARALQDPATRAAASRMRLHQGEARDLLPRLGPADVVHLDPMYPLSGREGGKAKGMRMMRELLGDDLDADDLLEVARQAATRRVAVKRHPKAPPLAGQRPAGSLRGKTVRYDLYPPAAKSSTGEGGG